MKASEFTERLERITNQAAREVNALMEEARIGLNDDRPVDFGDNPNTERAADRLAELTGWIYDRLNGRNRLHRQSMTRKIRKALGYNA